MSSEIFSYHQFLDFHTHRMRHEDRDHVMEIVSIHLGQERAKRYYTIGLHPWWTEQIVTPQERTQLSTYLTDPHCLGMGEMGLDNLKGPAMELQMDILRSQLQIAQELNKSVIIHCVRAFDQLIQIKKEFPKIEKWCVHGYGRHAVLARQLINQGFYLSLMPSLPLEKYEDLFGSLPHDRLFLETDSMPDVSIEEIYLQVSKLTGLTLAELCKQMNHNAREFFNL